MFTNSNEYAAGIATVGYSTTYTARDIYIKDAGDTGGDEIEAGP